ncbi:hypothetical protein HDU82_007223 [Entophlyctis luteolus]|nr:hypothetical protein HDU82_007223 [Entophlyctis luteolus]KAJ3386186.1 hypothetical protein HDU84_001766 [Entophlyctis sp. JEL0112]
MILILVTIAARIIYAATTVTNGAPFLDTAGNQIQAHGAGAIKVGSLYYWIGEDRNDDNTFRHVSAYRSSDLVNWSFTNNILSQASHPELNVSDIERPKVIYNERTKKFVLWMHWENGVDYVQARTAVATCDSVDGNYTYLGSFQPLGNDSRDLTVFVDDDANQTAYLFSATSSNANLNVYKLNEDYTNVTSLVATLFPGSYREAPGIFKRNGVYFLVTSQATYWNPNVQQYSTSTSITGTWGPLTDLVTSNSITHGSQNAYLLPITNSAGQVTAVLYMGDRWAGAWSQPVSKSEYVWLPLEFSNATTVSMAWFPKIGFNMTTGTFYGVGAGVGSASPYFYLEPRFSGKCLDVNGQSLVNGTALDQYTCNSGANQQFQVLQLEDGVNTYVLVARNSHMCVGLNASTSTSGVLVVQVVCDFQDTTQQWQFTEVSGVSNTFTVGSVFAGKCLDVVGYSTANLAGIDLWDCNGGQNQQWKLVSI